MTIPSALTLLVNVFTEPAEQARAIGVFGGCGAVGNGGLHPLDVRRTSTLIGYFVVLGLIIGAIFVQFANWAWGFWFVAMLAIPIGAL